MVYNATDNWASDISGETLFATGRIHDLTLRCVRQLPARLLGVVSALLCPDLIRLAKSLVEAHASRASGAVPCLEHLRVHLLSRTCRAAAISAVFRERVITHDALAHLVSSTPRGADRAGMYRLDDHVDELEVLVGQERSPYFHCELVRREEAFAR
jgi:hypothetical protein